jgi:hypothetical protein
LAERCALLATLILANPLTKGRLGT